MKVFIYLSCLFIFLPQISCKSQKEATLSEKFENESRVALVDTDDYSGIYEAETMVIRDMKTLSKFYSKINRTRKPGLPVPAIDFSKYTALAICAGEQKPNGKMMLSLGEEDDNKLKINIKLKKSNTESQSQITVVAHPFYVYTIPSTTKFIDFQYLK